MEASPSLAARVFEFGAALVGNGFGAWGVLSALTPILAEFVGAFMPDKFRAWMRARLPSTPAHRRAVFVATGALLLLIGAFQAFDEANGKLRSAQAELAQAKAEVAQLRSGGARQEQSVETARRQMRVSSQLSSFATRALDLWRADVTRDDYPRWARLTDALVEEAAKWAEDNLGADAKEKLLARPAFPNLPGARFVDPSQRERLAALDAISTNAPELMREAALNSLAPNPAAVPSPRSRP